MVDSSLQITVKSRQIAILQWPWLHHSLFAFWSPLKVSCTFWVLLGSIFNIAHLTLTNFHVCPRLSIIINDWFSLSFEVCKSFINFSSVKFHSRNLGILCSCSLNASYPPCAIKPVFNCFKPTLIELETCFSIQVPPNLSYIYNYNISNKFNRNLFNL